MCYYLGRHWPLLDVLLFYTLEVYKIRICVPNWLPQMVVMIYLIPCAIYMQILAYSHTYIVIMLHIHIYYVYVSATCKSIIIIIWTTATIGIIIVVSLKHRSVLSKCNLYIPDGCYIFGRIYFIFFVIISHASFVILYFSLQARITVSCQLAGRKRHESKCWSFVLGTYIYRYVPKTACSSPGNVDICMIPPLRPRV